VCSEKPNLNIRDLILVAPRRLPETGCLLSSSNPQKKPMLAWDRTRALQPCQRVPRSCHQKKTRSGLPDDRFGVLPCTRQPGLLPTGVWDCMRRTWGGRVVGQEARGGLEGGLADLPSHMFPPSPGYALEIGALARAMPCHLGPLPAQPSFQKSIILHTALSRANARWRALVCRAT
jgi:hypothetical protein